MDMQQLASMCSKVVERLGDSVEQMPRTLGIVHHALLDVVSQKFPNEKYEIVVDAQQQQ